MFEEGWICSAMLLADEGPSEQPYLIVNDRRPSAYWEKDTMPNIELLTAVVKIG